MFIEILSVFNFRNIEHVRLKPAHLITLIHGPNGAGKTSIIEAIGFLSSCRSFRSVNPSHLIRSGESGFTLQARVREQRGDTSGSSSLGVQRLRSDDIQISIDGRRTARVSELADRICVQLIHPHSTDMFTEPDLRRRFIDWGVYYMDPGFREYFANYKKCLRQRNALLKNRAVGTELNVWSEQLSVLSDRINACRTAYIEQLRSCLQPVLAAFLPEIRVQMAFYPGYPETSKLIDILTSNLEHDLQTGFTYHGCHRADLRLTVMGMAVGAVLSRGQMKLLACALRLAQGRLLHDTTGRHCIYMFDDISSEFDEHSRHLLLDNISELEHQVFITSISDEIQLPADHDSVEVQSGSVTAANG